MKIHIITLFPEMLEGPFDHSMLWKAKEKKLLEIELVNLRRFGIGPRKQVDDAPYGGGAGMVLKCEPIFAAVEKIKDDLRNSRIASSETPGGSRRNSTTTPAPALSLSRASSSSKDLEPSEDLEPKVILTTPRGQKFNQIAARRLAKEDSLIIICGHYEGFDERIMELVDEEISLGDFILTGGEIPAMAVVDAVARLIPGVLGDEASAHDESFSRGLLEYPHYTRPDDFRGHKVPDILKSGNHVKIEAWRREQAVKKTQANRPELLEF